MDGLRVVVVDNGSSDGTADWVIQQAGLELIQNPTNKGCAPAWNQGAKFAGALPDGHNLKAAGALEWLIIMNNDILLPISGITALLGAADLYGLDIASPAMREMDLNYDFETYASGFMGRLGGVVRRGAAHGVCFAVRAAVFSRIGGFDEGFRIGQFEDEDFFRRAREAGFKTGIVGACFIHHFGSVTQDALSDGDGRRPYEAQNRAYFRKKWRLGLVRRRWEKGTSAMLRVWWRATERLRFGHSLHEKWVRGRLRFL
jgi:GT2 family glycosyltransferase